MRAALCFWHILSITQKGRKKTADDISASILPFSFYSWWFQDSQKRCLSNLVLLPPCFSAFRFVYFSFRYAYFSSLFVIKVPESAPRVEHRQSQVPWVLVELSFNIIVSFIPLWHRHSKIPSRLSSQSLKTRASIFTTVWNDKSPDSFSSLQKEQKNDTGLIFVNVLQQLNEFWKDFSSKIFAPFVYLTFISLSHFVSKLQNSSETINKLVSFRRVAGNVERNAWEMNISSFFSSVPRLSWSRTIYNLNRRLAELRRTLRFNIK